MPHQPLGENNSPTTTSGPSLSNAYDTSTASAPSSSIIASAGDPAPESNNSSSSNNNNNNNISNDSSNNNTSTLNTTISASSGSLQIPPSSQSSYVIPPASSVSLIGDPVIKEVLHSDIGVVSLLRRLKMSILSCKELAAYVKKKALVEEDRNSDLKRVIRNTREVIKKPESRQDSFAHQFEEIVRIDEKNMEVATQYITALTTMHDELMDLAKATEKARKSLKESGLKNEKNVADAEQQMEKAKSKYEGLVDELDRVKQGDSKKTFGFKSSRHSGPQYEEEVQRKVWAAENDYKQKVSHATRLRQELLKTLRPDCVQRLRSLIYEIDSGSTLQLQKFSNLCESLVLGQGMAICPIKSQNSVGLSMRDLACLVDNELDFYNYFKKIARDASITAPKPMNLQQPSTTNIHQQQQQQQQKLPQPQSLHQPSSSEFVHSIPQQQHHQPQQQQQPPTNVPTIPEAPSSSSQTQLPLSSDDNAEGSSLNTGEVPLAPPPPPPQGVFGAPLEDLLDYEGGTVPIVVYQCIRAVDTYGLDVEGLYRTSGSSYNIQKIKNLFDTDAAHVDFSNPEAFFNDITSVAGALKQFFRELPDPLLTRDLHHEFISAARIEHDIQRRDAVHRVVNQLPDANYTTLRYLIFHLYRVQQHESANRMSVYNLGIVWGPSLLGSNYNNVADLSFQSRVIETILLNAYVIFDADE